MSWFRVLACISAGLFCSIAATHASSFQSAVLVAFDYTAFDQFGKAVAIDGDTVVVGSPFDDDLGASSGSAYVYQLNGSLWKFQAKLTADDGNASDQFGHSVSISGNTIVVGARFADHPGPGTFAGAAYVFDRNGTNWSQTVKLVASDPPLITENAETFGTSVGISGNRIVVGNPLNTDVTGTGGAAYIFEKSGVTWSEQIKLMTSDGFRGDQFGSSVAISGQSVIVGTDPFAGGNGKAYVFQGLGAIWTEQAQLTPTDGGGGSYAISVDIDGVRAIVGDSSGAAYIFKRNGLWTQESKLTAFDYQTGDQFGISVSLRGDRAIVGAKGDDHPGGRDNAGSAYLFERTMGVWAGMTTKLIPADLGFEDAFGGAVAISGQFSVVGADLDNVGGRIDSGSAYIFTQLTNPPPGRLLGLNPNLTNTQVLMIELNPFSVAPLVGGAGVGRLSGLDVQPGTGTFFASSGNGDGGRLYTLDFATGEATLVGATGFSAVPGLAFDADGTLYATAATTANGDTLITVDTGTGAGTAVGAMGQSLIEALAFHPSTGILYGSGGSSEGDSLFTIDKVTGIASLLGTISETESGDPLPSFLAGLAFDGNGSLFGSLGDGDGQIIAIDLAQLTFTRLGYAAGGSVSDIAFTPSTMATTATISPATPGFATISWTPNTPGVVLQETVGLSPANWTNSISGPTNPVVVPTTFPTKFYRLYQP